MAAPESKLEMVERHVREGEAHVARQREIVAGLRADLHPVKEAERLLALFEEILEVHKEHLARIMAEDG